MTAENQDFSKSKTYYNSSKDSFLQKFCSPKWRMNRMAYFLYNLILWIIFFGLIVLLWLSWLLDWWLISEIIFIIIALAYLYLYIILLIKRLHDINAPGWVSLIFLMFSVGVFALLFIPGTKWENKFWPQIIKKKN
jgi:uncharacterized membrane protein YhaH (DUF805 family)